MIDQKEANHLLQLCDNLRDEIMPQMGVRFEDHADFPWKLFSKADLLKEKEDKKKEQREKFVKTKLALDNDIERWEKSSVSFVNDNYYIHSSNYYY